MFTEEEERDARRRERENDSADGGERKIHRIIPQSKKVTNTEHVVVIGWRRIVHL